MPEKQFEIKTIRSNRKQRILNVRPDAPDIRDRDYEPALVKLAAKIDPPKSLTIRDQGNEGACTGFGLAAVINLLNTARGNSAFKASTRMLYEMAQKHDEWPGEDYAGSSCRGAIRGWKNMGVCSEADWPYETKKPGFLTIERAYHARTNTLGAYYRLRPEINDYHSALNEVGALFVSANVHEGWFSPKKLTNGGLAIIQPHSKNEGGHAFAIVGYSSDGFIVQNSWGDKWASNGLAVWLYQDWINNVNDGWVFRMAVSTPQIFGLTSSSSMDASESGKRAPKRLEIAGHFAHFDDGSLKRRGDYWSTKEDIQQTADLLKKSASEGKYQHLLIYCHGGLNSPKASAKRISALKTGFMRNGIYPFHIMYDTGLAEELKDVVTRAFHRSEGFVDRLKEKITDFTDKLIEGAVRIPGSALWEEMKRDARLPFEVDSGDQINDGVFVIKTFAETLADTDLKIHLVGHSTGAVVIGHLLDALDSLGIANLIHSCSLMAPACTTDFYKKHYRHRLSAISSSNTGVRLPKLDCYNLNKELEKDDQVAFAYRKSLLYLVSRAFERESPQAILGMELYKSKIRAHPALRFHYSDGKSGNVTRSSSHGGFDNDYRTMNSILKRILGRKPSNPFLKSEMKGY